MRLGPSQVGRFGDRWPGTGPGLVLDWSPPDLVTLSGTGPAMEGPLGATGPTKNRFIQHRNVTAQMVLNKTTGIKKIVIANELSQLTEFFSVVGLL